MRTKIDERREREEIDRQYPWQPMSKAVPDGSICELLFSDLTGELPSRPALFFLHTDRRTWYRVDQAQPNYRKAMNWRSFGKTLTLEHRNRIIRSLSRSEEDYRVRSNREMDRRMS